MAHCLNTMIKVYCLLSLVKLTFTSQVDSQRVKTKKVKCKNEIFSSWTK